MRRACAPTASKPSRRTVRVASPNRRRCGSTVPTVRGRSTRCSKTSMTSAHRLPTPTTSTPRWPARRYRPRKTAAVDHRDAAPRRPRFAESSSSIILEEHSDELPRVVGRGDVEGHALGGELKREGEERAAVVLFGCELCDIGRGHVVVEANANTLVGGLLRDDVLSEVLPLREPAGQVRDVEGARDGRGRLKRGVLGETAACVAA